MMPAGPLNGLPIACTLTVGAGREQVRRWRAFDADYLIEAERTETRVVVHYARTDESALRLRELVMVESECCSFLDWRVEDEQKHLRLIVKGTPEQLDALNVG